MRLLALTAGQLFPRALKTAGSVGRDGQKGSVPGTIRAGLPQIGQRLFLGMAAQLTLVGRKNTLEDATRTGER